MFLTSTLELSCLFSCCNSDLLAVKTCACKSYICCTFYISTFLYSFFHVIYLRLRVNYFLNCNKFYMESIASFKNRMNKNPTIPPPKQKPNIWKVKLESCSIYQNFNQILNYLKHKLLKQK